MSDALRLDGIQKNFGALQVASDISLSLPVGARTALIGPNGAGKTTFVNMVTGALAPSSGTIRYFRMRSSGTMLTAFGGIELLSRSINSMLCWVARAL